MSDPADLDRLLARAWAARARAYAPYSGFLVGAAVQGASGAIYTGCNVENASIGLTVCAERVAVFQAVLAGERALIAAAVVAASPAPPTLCGACRQVLREFAADLPLVCANQAGQRRVYRLGELLPDSFGPEAFQSVQPYFSLL
ncbi:MAG: cytidine deaminase [Chloroflexi bacterium]|nr:cytidine deaminase [Chloroflexota bacterium]